GFARLPGKAAMKAGERVFAEQLRMPGPQFRQRLQHDVGVAKAGQRTVDRTEAFAAPAEPAALVILDELKNGPDFLHALSRFVDRLGARRSRGSKPIAPGFELLPPQPPQPLPNPSVAPQSDPHPPPPATHLLPAP